MNKFDYITIYCQVYILWRYVLKCNKLQKSWINFKQKLYTWTVYKSRKSCKCNMFWMMRFYGHIKFKIANILQFSFVLLNYFFWKDAELTIFFAFGGTFCFEATMLWWCLKTESTAKSKNTLLRETSKQANKHNKNSNHVNKYNFFSFDLYHDWIFNLKRR